MATAAILGFVLLLAGWFGMYLRVRRDHPQHPLARYGNYIGPIKTGSWRLVTFYRRQYGLDAWPAVFFAGMALMALVILAGLATG